MILVVDDHADGRYVMVRLLRGAGYAAASAADGASALAWMAADLPRLVLLDYHMPGRTGGDVLRAMRADPRLAGVPVLLWSAGGREEIVEEMTAAGAAGVLFKGRGNWEEQLAQIARHAGPPGRPVG